MRRPRVFILYAGLDRSIYVLFLAQVVNSLGHFVHPFLTMFLTQKLGMGPLQAGSFVMLTGVAWIPGSLLGGKIADQAGRKAIMVLFHALSGLSLVPCAFLGTSPLIPWLLIASSFFRGAADPVNDAMLTDLTSTDRRQAAFSLLYLGHNLGFAAGPMIAGFLFNRFLAWIFLADAFTTGLAVLAILLFVQESAPSAEQISRSFAEDRSPQRAEKGSLLGVLLRRPFLLAFMLIHILLSFVYSQTGFSLPLQLSAVFAERGPQVFGTVMAFNALTVILLTTLVIQTTARLRPALNVAVSGLFFAVGFGMIAYARSLPLLLLSTLIWTVGEILQATNSSVYVANHAPLTHRARLNSIAPIIMWSGQGFGPLLSARLIERFSVDRIWLFSFFISLLASALLLLIFRLEGGGRAGAPESEDAPAS